MGMSYFQMYFSYEEFLKLLTDEECGQLIMSLYEYCRSGTVPPFTGAMMMAFTVIRQQIDRDSEAYLEKCERNRSNGKKGGAPKGNQNARKQPTGSENNPNNPPVEKTTETTQGKGEGEGEGKGEGKEEGEYRAAKPPQAKRKRFVPPTLEAVKAYCHERGNGIDPQRFVDYYTSNGWMVGKTHMKDWKAAVRNWERQSGKGNPGNFETGQRNKGPEPLDIPPDFELVTGEDGVQRWRQKQ